MKNDNGKNISKKKAQITIFVILALILVVIFIILFLLLKKPNVEVEVYDENNPQGYLESCTIEAVEDAISVLSPQGGDIVPKGSIRYQDIDRVYLCYIDDFYERCVNKRPMLIEHIENEITDYITPMIQDCFKTMIEKYSERYDFEAKGSEIAIKTKLEPRLIVITLDKDLKMTREEELRDFNDFKIKLVHPLYDLAEVAMEIANQEARFCDFDDLGYMILHKTFDIKKSELGEADIIYTITHRPTEESFTFAVRSCKLPPGI